MRLEATISDPRGEQLQHLADELRVSKSQVIEEALALFQKAVMEVQRGYRVAAIDAATQRPICEMASPSLTQIEWAIHRSKLTLTDAEATRVDAALRKPAPPPPALKRAMARGRSDK